MLQYVPVNIKRPIRSPAIMEILTALLGSQTKVKLLRLFLFNPSTVFLPRDIASRTKCRPPSVRSELIALTKADIVKKRRTGGETGYVLNDRFPYLDPLRSLLTVASIQADDSLSRRFAGIGKTKLIVAAGIFIQNWDSRVDLLVVGDQLNMARIESVIRGIEADIGKEITYSAFETQDFEYRLGIHDRLVRDILDYPHVKLLDRLGMV